MQSIERWVMGHLPQDKCLHVIAGVIVFALVHLLARLGVPYTQPVIGLAVVAVVGALKELLDHFDGGDPSIYDWLATCAGGALAFACSFQA
ncbi:hypothetical protein [Paraburkholderia unamae]|uniref:VanZ like protein n=1 Tax=Paraburkholderia unamae TaxID=219649 RepID=A0ABX5KTD5_9BURK|nr:hypothetical protein [Paraburkholderia unamae]PVX84359.1 hypothetical protein C7402_105200 [Paraburkholderia unamae]